MKTILTPRAEQQFYAMIRRQNRLVAERVRLEREPKKKEVRK